MDSATFANLWANYILSVIVAVLTAALILPIEDDKGYMSLYYFLKYAARYKIFVKKNEAESQKIPSIEDITPFTGIDGNFIAYGSAYSAVVMSIPSVEFRFYSESRQNNMIDHVFGGILRTAVEDETINLVKLDQPVIYDRFIDEEYRKIEALKESYLNAMMDEDELRTRVGILYDRIEELKRINYKDRVFVPFHYLVFIHKDREFLQNQIEDAIADFANVHMECKQLKGPELAVFLKYNYNQVFDEREVQQLQPEQYMDWILPHEIRYTMRTASYDNLITHQFRLRDYPTVVGNAWGSGLFNEPGTRVVMKMKPIERYKGVRFFFPTWI